MILRPVNVFKTVRRETNLDYQNSRFSCSNSISKTLDKPAYTHSLFLAYWALGPSVYMYDSFVIRVLQITLVIFECRDVVIITSYIHEIDS